MRPAIQPYGFLRRAVQLQQPLTDMTVLHTVPDSMGRKTAITFVDKRTFKALLLLCTPKSSQPVLGFIGMGGLCNPTTEQKRKERYGAHRAP